MFVFSILKLIIKIKADMQAYISLSVMSVAILKLIAGAMFIFRDKRR